MENTITSRVALALSVAALSVSGWLAFEPPAPFACALTEDSVTVDCATGEPITFTPTGSHEYRDGGWRVRS